MEARLLIVDDEPKLCGLLERYLVRVGYTVDSCGTAEAAMDRFRAEPAQFAMVITDLTLPGLNGEDLLAQMRVVRPDLLGLVTSGYPYEPRAPRTRFLQKPFLPQMLADTVKEMLAAR